MNPPPTATVAAGRAEQQRRELAWPHPAVESCRRRLAYFISGSPMNTHTKYTKWRLNDSAAHG